MFCYYWVRMVYLSISLQSVTLFNRMTGPPYNSFDRALKLGPNIYVRIYWRSGFLARPVWLINRLYSEVEIEVKSSRNHTKKIEVRHNINVFVRCAKHAHT